MTLSGSLPAMLTVIATLTEEQEEQHCGDLAGTGPIRVRVMDGGRPVFRVLRETSLRAIVRDFHLTLSSAASS